MQRLSGFQNGLIAVYARILAAAYTIHWSCAIGHDAWLGANAEELSGVIIGDGAVVSHDVAPFVS
jgi:acetyltransferase-like isoleucine patch superfamily enzyme